MSQIPRPILYLVVLVFLVLALAGLYAGYSSTAERRQGFGTSDAGAVPAPPTGSVADAKAYDPSSPPPPGPVDPAKAAADKAAADRKKADDAKKADAQAEAEAAARAQDLLNDSAATGATPAPAPPVITPPPPPAAKEEPDLF